MTYDGTEPDDVKARWEALRLEALARLSAVTCGDYHELLRLKAIDDLHWYAGHDSASALGRRAREALETVDIELPLRLAHAICSPHSRRGPVDIEAQQSHVSLEQAAETCRAVAEEFARARPATADQAAIIAAVVADAEGLAMSPSPYSFVHALLEASAGTAEDLCREIRMRPDLGPLLGTLPQCLMALRRLDVGKAAQVAEEAANDGHPGLRAAVLETYARLPPGTPLSKREGDLLDALETSADENTRLGVFMARVALASGDRRAVLGHAHAFDMGQSPTLAEGFLRALFHPGPLDATELSLAELGPIMEKLVPVMRIHAWEVTHFLEAAARQHPMTVARFLLARVKHAAVDDYPYDPIPFSGLNQAFTPLRDSPEWPAAMREARDLALDSDARDVVSAFALLSLGYAPESIGVLQEWLVPGAPPERIAAIVDLLKNADTGFFFENQEFLRNLVHAIEGLDRGLRKSLSARLVRHPSPKSGIKAAGVPDPKTVERMERAEAQAAACSAGDPLRGFYLGVAAESRRSIEFDRRMDEAHLDNYGS